eukprot:259352_1
MSRQSRKIAKANTMKAKHVPQSSGHVPQSSGEDVPMPKSKNQHILKDTVSLTLNNLSSYFQGWKCSVPQAPTLHKIASVIWLYLPNDSMEEYVVNFEDATNHKIIESVPKSAPVLATTSPKGDILLMVE